LVEDYYKLANEIDRTMGAKKWIGPVTLHFIALGVNKEMVYPEGDGQLAVNARVYQHGLRLIGIFETHGNQDLRHAIKGLRAFLVDRAEYRAGNYVIDFRP